MAKITTNESLEFHRVCKAASKGEFSKIVEMARAFVSAVENMSDSLAENFQRQCVDGPAGVRIPKGSTKSRKDIVYDEFKAGVAQVAGFDRVDGLSEAMDAVAKPIFFEKIKAPEPKSAKNLMIEEIMRRLRDALNKPQM